MKKGGGGEVAELSAYEKRHQLRYETSKDFSSDRFVYFVMFAKAYLSFSSDEKCI